MKGLQSYVTGVFFLDDSENIMMDLPFPEITNIAASNTSVMRFKYFYKKHNV